MAKHLEAAGVPTQLMVAEGMVHIYFSVTEVFPSAKPWAVKAAQEMGKLMRA